MDVKRSQLKSDEEAVTESAHCPKCATSFKLVRKPNPLVVDSGKPEKNPTKPLDCGYVMQIVSIGIRSDNVYEARMLLSPEVDMSSIKITVKGTNLRVNVCRPLNDQFVSRLPEIVDKSSAGDIVKKMMKHCENLLVPDGIDSAKVRAVVDNKNRMLVLTAPAMKPSKTTPIFLFSLTAMDKLPLHCQENATTLKQNDYMNFEIMTNGFKMSLRFDRVPNFYIIDNKELYAAEIKIEGLKVGTATLATENMLNIKLHSVQDWSYIRNLNFLIPPEANAKKVSIEIFNNTIFMRAPLKKKHT